MSLIINMIYELIDTRTNEVLFTGNIIQIEKKSGIARTILMWSYTEQVKIINDKYIVKKKEKNNEN